MDFLKILAPFGKKERIADGTRWVEVRASDDAAAGRWDTVLAVFAVLIKL